MGRHQQIASLAQLTDTSSRLLEVADLDTTAARTVRMLLANASSPIRVHCLNACEELYTEYADDERVRIIEEPVGETLPLADAGMDRLISVNAIERVLDPLAYLEECYRILKPGGLLVLANTDWDTTLFASEDDALTRCLIDRYVSHPPTWELHTDGFMGRKLLGIARHSQFMIESVQTWADQHQRFDDNSMAHKVARGVLAAAADDAQLAALAADWVAGLHRLADEGRFLFTVTDVALQLRKPAA